MNFKANVKKFQSIEDGTISVLLRVPAEEAASVMSLYKQDVVVRPADIGDTAPHDELLTDIRNQLETILRRLQ